MKVVLYLLVVLYETLLSAYVAHSSPCDRFSFRKGRFVCVCTEQYCDELDSLVPSASQAVLYETTKQGARFESSTLNFTTKVSPGIPLLFYDESEIYQFIVGFGGAFTDATGINLNSLSSGLRDQVMKSYFGQNGLEYNMGRIPIASTDFSTYPYTYDDTQEDLDLKHFQLAKEDFLYKIPYIHNASALSQTPLLLFGSPWSPPAWMKTNNKIAHGSLKGQPGGPYFKAYANYLVRFIQEYSNQNIMIWGLTLQNEPNFTCVHNFSAQSMCFPPESQRDFLKKDLGPALKKAGLTPDVLKLMIMDDTRLELPKSVDVMVSDPDVLSMVSGIAFHWYFEDLAPHRLLSITRAKYPGLFLLSTEACTGYMSVKKPKVRLGNWRRAERYAHDILQDLLNWSVGWVDWNMALNLEGGPNWVKNYVDAPIIVDPENERFYKQPMYYALAHFSKVLPRGSQRVRLKQEGSVSSDLEVVAFRTPQYERVLIALNRVDDPIQVYLFDTTKGYLNISISGHAIQSYVW